MRISKVTLFGLAALAGAAAANNASAADVNISTATTTPLSTSLPDGVSAGDITVASGGSITVDENETAITLDSNNDVTAGGSLISDDADNSTGLLINGGFTGTVSNTGSINLREEYELEDDDADGDLDGVWAEGTNRVGIHVVGATAFTGDVTHGGSMIIEGNDSAGILLDGALTGDLVSSGGISVTGDDSVGIAINGGVTGDVTVSGGISVRGENSVGILVDSAINGALNLTSTINVSGFHSVTRPTTEEGLDALDADDLLLSASGVDLRYSVSGGVTFGGIGVEDDEDDDDDGETEEEGDTDDDKSSAIIVFGSAPAVWIRPDVATPTNIVLGATASGYGIVNRGSIGAAGVYDGVSATALRIEGVGGATVTTANGLLNDSFISAEAAEADAYGVFIGADASVPAILNRKSITARSISETAEEAVALNVAADATVNSITNNGVIAAQFDGDTGAAVAIRDQSNTLTSITNSGTIRALIVPSDDDATVTADAIALDVSASTVGVTFNQIADVPFTDDDDEDADVDNRPAVTVIGEMRFGSGADAINLNAGTIIGNISFGAGADTFSIDNGASYTGFLSDSDGQLSLNVLDGSLNLTGGEVEITTAHFGADGNLGIVLANDAADATLILADGVVTFDDGAVITPTLPSALPDAGTQVFLTAIGGIVGADNVTGVITDGAPFLYNLSIELADGDPNSLAATFEIKSAAQLGLNVNQAAALDPILAGLRLNSAAGTAFATLTDQASFIDAYEDLLPNYSSAAAELAATAIQQQQSASGNRLAAARLRDVREQSVWAQEIGYGLERDASSPAAADYSGYGFGFAAGIDKPLDNGALAGVSVSFISSQAEEPGRADGEISASFGQLNAYMGTSLGGLNIDVIAGGGVGKLRSRRFVEIGSSFESLSEAEWWAYEGHGAVRLSLPMRAGRFSVTPQTALTYVALNENSFTESGGGTGIDYDVDSVFRQRLWGDVGVEFTGVFGETADRRANIVVPRLMLGWRANLINEAEERTFRVASGGADFTLADQDYGDGAALAAIGFTAGNSYSTFSLGYEGEFGDDLTRHSLNASIRIRF